MGLFKKDNGIKSSISADISKVKQLLDTAYDIDDWVELEPGHWLNKRGSCVLSVKVEPRGEDEPAYVCVLAHVLSDVADTDKLYRHLLREEPREFYSWVVTPSDVSGKVDVALMRAMYLDDLDAEELGWTTMSAVKIGDSIDNDLQKRFGGQLSGDAIS